MASSSRNVDKTRTFAQTDKDLEKMSPFRRSREVTGAVKKTRNSAQTDEELMEMASFRQSNEGGEAMVTETVKSPAKKIVNSAEVEEELAKMDYVTLEDEEVGSNQNVENPFAMALLRAEDRAKEREQRRMENIEVMRKSVQAIDLIFRYLQNRSRVLIWLYRNNKLRIEGHILGYDQYLSMIIDEAEEVYVVTGVKKPVGKILLRGDNVSLIQNVQPTARKIVDYSDCIN